MAESQQKRLRSDDSNPISKRQRPNSNILEDDEPSHEISAIFTALQHEISSVDFDSPPSEDEVARSVMRHLLEASDDELGIPNPEECNSNGDCGGYSSDFDFDFDFDFSPFVFVDKGIWEVEDMAANYYTVLQSELFM